MKNKKSIHSRNTKFVRVNNSTWIETDALIPDDVARIQFLQKMQLTKPSPYLGHVKSENLIIRS